MKCLILAAGYATRLYPLTENFPKPLLKVGNKAILDWLIDDLEQTGLIDEYIVVTNHKFAHIFEEWSNGRYTIIDDGTTSNETRLGAVKDIELALNPQPHTLTPHPSTFDPSPSTCDPRPSTCDPRPSTLNPRPSTLDPRPSTLDDDLLVMAGDNLLDFSLKGFLDYAKEKGTTCIMRYYEPNTERLHKCGVVEVDDCDKILSMEEKPANPKSHWCCPPFYFYKKEDLPYVSKGIAEGCGTDAPGSFIAWLCGRTAVHAWEMPGLRYDIGSLESYEAVKKIFQ